MPRDDEFGEPSSQPGDLPAHWLADLARLGGASAEYVPGRTDDERVLATIWQEVLGVDRVGIDDDYFELGGDSVHAIVVVARAQEAGRQLEPEQLLTGRTVRAVAALMTATTARPAGDGPDPGGEHPLTPLQHGMLYHAVGGSTPGAYLIQVSCRLVGDLDQDTFAAAWRAVFDANPVLRTVIRWRDGDRASQRVEAELRLPVRFVDHRHAGPAARDRSFARLLDADRQAGFDLEHGPLMRLALVAEGPSEYRCVWTYHHLILDGWSQQLVLRDVFDCYRRLRAGHPPAPRRRPSFLEYVEELGGAGAPDGFWARRFVGLTEATRIAGPGCVDGQVTTAPRPQAERALPAPVTEALAALAVDHGVTAAAVVHAAWALLLGLRTGARETVHGATLAGRPPHLPGVTESIGMFVNTLPLRVATPPDTAVLDWLHGVGAGLAEVRSRQRDALSDIERQVGLGQGTGLFDSIVVVENFPTWIGAGDEIADLRIDRLSVVVEEGYPLVLEYTPGTGPALRARFDERRLDRPTVERMLAVLAATIGAVGADPGQRLAALAETARLTWARHRDDQRQALREEAGSRLGSTRRRTVPGGGVDTDA
ncbi:Phosphopantetheine attachment site [Micromonospora haikouensis]|uniref:Phosphopantetheine attachment site n=1 Tax=Micromonospora haikouensis TaxID=686309 RepID=A0A1C4XH85_9ACTN|nr:condensation domain-containing protein [Micromonospora haikouensis]SCF07737.1 Phosphopantetheine attachment site [Micromonospora haikouensis]